MAVPDDEVDEALDSELAAVGGSPFGDAVGVEQDAVTRLEPLGVQRDRRWLLHVVELGGAVRAAVLRNVVPASVDRFDLGHAKR